MKKIKDLAPGDVFDIAPVLERLDIAANAYGLYEVEEVWQEQPGVTVVCSTEGGNWALPSDEEVSLYL